MAGHIESYSPEQLRSLAAKKEAEERQNVVRFQESGADGAPQALNSNFTGTVTVDACGMELEIDRTRMNNWRLLELLERANAMDVAAIMECLDIAIGRETRSELMAYLGSISDTGYPRITDVMASIEAIFDTVNAAKNS